MAAHMGLQVARSVWTPGFFGNEELDKFYQENQTQDTIDLILGLDKAMPNGIVDKDNRVIQGMASTKDLDRVDDIILPEAFDKAFKEYLDNGGVLLFNHNRNNPVGKTLSGEITQNGLFIVGQVFKDDDLADKCWNWIDKETLKHFSVSIIPKQVEYQSPSGGPASPWDGIRIIKDLSLLEISLAVIAANPFAKFGEKKTFNGVYYRLPEDMKPKEDGDDKTVDVIYKKLEAMLCTEFTDTYKKSIQDSFDECKALLVKHGKNAPEFKSYDKIEWRAFKADTNYEFLPVIRDGKMMVWENTTNKFTPFEELPRFVKKHIYDSDIYDRLISKSIKSTGAVYSWTDDFVDIKDEKSVDIDGIKFTFTPHEKFVANDESVADFTRKLVDHVYKKFGIDRPTDKDQNEAQADSSSAETDAKGNVDGEEQKQLAELMRSINEAKAFTEGLEKQLDVKRITLDVASKHFKKLKRLGDME